MQDVVTTKVEMLDADGIGEDQPVKSQSADNSSPQIKSQLISCLAGEYVDLTQENEVGNIMPSPAEMELESTSESVWVMKPLNWWKQYEVTFPKLAPEARRYMYIPATEVASERAFSTACNTVTKRRASLDPGLVDELIFIHNTYELPKVATGTIPATSRHSTTATVACTTPCVAPAVSAPSRPPSTARVTGQTHTMPPPTLPSLDLRGDIDNEYCIVYGWIGCCTFHHVILHGMICCAYSSSRL